MKFNSNLFNVTYTDRRHALSDRFPRVLPRHHARKARSMGRIEGTSAAIRRRLVSELDEAVQRSRVDRDEADRALAAIRAVREAIAAAERLIDDHIARLRSEARR